MKCLPLTNKALYIIIPENIYNVPARRRFNSDYSLKNITMICLEIHILSSLVKYRCKLAKRLNNKTYYCCCFKEETAIRICPNWKACFRKKYNRTFNKFNVSMFRLSLYSFIVRDLDNCLCQVNLKPYIYFV